jgi:hypothetical protein
MDTYSKLLENEFDKHHGVYIYGWNKFLTKKNTNKNILPTKTIKKEKEIIKNLLDGIVKDDDVANLRNIHSMYKLWSEAGRHYYEGEKNLSNEQVKFSYDVLKHLTQNIICYNIELIMRKVLIKHLENTYPENNFEDNITILDFMLGKNYQYGDSKKVLLSILYEEISEKIVKNTIEYFYKDDNDKATHLANMESTSEILNSFFGLLTVSETYKIEENSNTMIILKGTIIYFELFIKKLVENWQIVIENQFRYVINQERILDCLLKMM